MTDIDPILGIIKPEDLAHLHAVKAANCDECPVLENREHDIAELTAEIVQLKDKIVDQEDQIRELKLRRVYA